MNYLRDRIENITETDFWSSLRSTPAIAAARKAGLAGKKATAYRLLGAYHAEGLRGEAEAYREGATALIADPGSAAELRRRADMVLRHEIQGLCQLQLFQGFR